MEKVDTRMQLRHTLDFMAACVELGYLESPNDITQEVRELLGLGDEDIRDLVDTAYDAANNYVLDIDDLYDRGGKLARVELLLTCNGPTVSMDVKVCNGTVTGVTYHHSMGKPLEIYTGTQRDNDTVGKFLAILALSYG
jgi:hypothetical protein